MNTSRKGSTALITTATFASALLAAACSLAGSHAMAGVLWSDTAYESVSIPLESPALGLTRAKMYLDKGETERAAAALRKVVEKYPTFVEAHQLLASIYRGQGRLELASLHERLARQG